MEEDAAERGYREREPRLREAHLVLLLVWNAGDAPATRRVGSDGLAGAVDGEGFVAGWRVEHGDGHLIPCLQVCETTVEAATGKHEVVLAAAVRCGRARVFERDCAAQAS